MALLLLAQKAERPKSQLVCLTQMEGITSPGNARLLHTESARYVAEATQDPY